MMPWMLPWLLPWWVLMALQRAPLSGDVTQSIAPLTNWFSPQLAFNIAGDPRIEQAVVAQVASYGRQLGILTEAVLALAGDRDDDEIRRLREVQQAVEAIKTRYQGDPEQIAAAALTRLRDTDPEALQRLLARFAS